MTPFGVPYHLTCYCSEQLAVTVTGYLEPPKLVNIQMGSRWGPRWMPDPRSMVRYAVWIQRGSLEGIQIGY